MSWGAGRYEGTDPSQSAEIAALRARVEGLEAALRECADDLEAEVRATHGADHPDGIHPSQERKYERDMEPVDRARALLEKKP